MEAIARGHFPPFPGAQAPKRRTRGGCIRCSERENRSYLRLELFSAPSSSNSGGRSLLRLAREFPAPSPSGRSSCFVSRPPGSPGGLVPSLGNSWGSVAAASLLTARKGRGCVEAVSPHDIEAGRESFAQWLATLLLLLLPPPPPLSGSCLHC